MKKTKSSDIVLMLLEALFVLTFVWIIVRDLGRKVTPEQTIVAAICVLSGLALLICSFVFRSISPFSARLGWLILFLALLAAVFFPRL